MDFSFFEPLWKSFYSRSLYKRVASEWRGWGARQLFLISIVVCSIYLLTWQWTLSKQIQEHFLPVAEQIPPISIINGIASVSEPQPYIITDPQTKNPIMLIDTTDQLTIDPGQTYFMILTKEFVSYQKNPLQSQNISLHGIKKLNLNGEQVKNWVILMDKWLMFSCFPFALLCIWVVLASIAFLVGIFACLLARLFGRSIDYLTGVRLAAVALTPTLLIDCFEDIPHKSIPFEGFYWFLIGIFYLVLAVWWGTSRSQKESIFLRLKTLLKRKKS